MSKFVNIDHETPLPQDNIETPKRRTLVITEIGNKTDEIYDLHKFVKSLATEMEAMKLFITEQFYLLKKSILEINSNTDATDKRQICSVSLLNFYCKKTRLKTLS